MLRLLTIVSGAFEALFGVAAMLATSMVTDALGTDVDPAAVFFARVLCAATLGIGIAALLARNELQTHGGLAAACGLTLYNVLAVIVILWTAAELGGPVLPAVAGGAAVFEQRMGRGRASPPPRARGCRAGSPASRESVRPPDRRRIGAPSPWEGLRVVPSAAGPRSGFRIAPRRP